MTESPCTPARSAAVSVVAALVVVVGAWLTPAGIDGVGEQCAAAAGQVRVWLVVDFGGLPGAPGGVRTMCITVAEGSTGTAALLAGFDGLRWNSSGLLCAIGGYPASPECGERSSGGYRYWSYWRGGGEWTYSSIGPDGHQVRDGDVEGWHFVAGRGNPGDPPPGASPASGCPTQASQPPANRPPGPVSPTSPGQSATGASPAPRSEGGAGGVPARAAPANGSSESDSGASPAGSGDAAPGAPGATAPAGESAASEDAAQGEHGPAGPTEGDASTGSSSDVGSADPERADGETSGDRRSGPAEEAALGSAPVATASEGSMPVGMLVGVPLIAVIAAGAWLQSRKRAA